ncbi:hypothetical protein ACFQ49_06770 [Kroppenstedtia eburnea]|uniref:Uncharacterized protein n=1 Tax=Kroppenstedtia eburnea TaxID=714067 RepID=A0A1N7PDM6_9BACL|nr:hypothetical protein [Kroppenstedtia eburnea]EGK11088.1 hypothetical protein HMPREF9374_2157 [Desmospora sp. 8437]QKI83335.1 hypothetical protein GXN75_15825 [Kroppenstedtia eburnea]SIT08630.1 hypothetical protein SAMN05421790_11231 [Kroppenstedtia eburnea]
MKVKVPDEGEIIIPGEELKRLRILLKEARQLDAFDLNQGTLPELVALALNRGIGRLEDELTRLKLAQKQEDLCRE